MRIFYRYYFDITKSIPIQNSYKTVISLVEHLGVNYEEVLFKFYDFVDKKSSVNKKIKVQRLLDMYPQYTDYYFCDPCTFASDINYVGFTNCEPDNWNKSKSYVSGLSNIIEEITLKIPRPWNIDYQIVFNQIGWFGNSLPQIEITSKNKDRVPTLLPISSNISIGWNGYERKNKVILSFEITESTKEYKRYVEETAAFLKTNYKEFNSYVYFEDEEIFFNKNIEKNIKQTINKYEEKVNDILINKLAFENGTSTISPRKAICKLIKNLDFMYFGCENGVYAISKVDKYNHQVKIYLDYAGGILSAAIRYTGINFLYSFNIQDIQPKFQEEVEEYFKYVLAAVNELEGDLFDIISSSYPETPNWFTYCNS